MSLAIIIAAFDEQESIVSTIDAVQSAMQTTDFDFELIMVDDGSGEKTLEIARSRGAGVLRHDQNKSCGASLNAGIQKAQFGLIAIIDDDGTYPAGDLPHLLAYRTSQIIVTSSACACSLRPQAGFGSPRPNAGEGLGVKDSDRVDQHAEPSAVSGFRALLDQSAACSPPHPIEVF